MDVWYTPESAAAYREIDRRRAERYARRMKMLEHDARVERVLAVVWLAVETFALCVSLYLCLYLWCIWESC